VVLALAAACGGGADPEPSPRVVLIGDSTTVGFGTAAGYVLAERPPLALLTDLLPPGSRWRRMEVVALGVLSSTTRDWAVAYPTCHTSTTVAAGIPAFAALALRACVDGSALVDHVTEVVGRPIDAALLILGTNDPYRHDDATVDETLRNLRSIVDRLAPTPVLVASPFWSPHPSRHDFIEALAERLDTSDFLRGPDFARQRLPVDRSKVHLTRGGFVAAAALWLDALDRVPGDVAPAPAPRSFP